MTKSKMTTLESITPEVLDIYERKVSEQGDRFDSSNGILVGGLGAQIAVFVFYADVFAKSLHIRPDYWFSIVLAILLAGISIIGWLLFSSNYRAAPIPDVFAENTQRDGIKAARSSAVEDLDSAYDENRSARENPRSILGWILIVTVLAIVASLVAQSTQERIPMQPAKQEPVKELEKAVGSAQQYLFVSDWTECPSDPTWR